MSEAPVARRCLLFFGGDRPDRLDKARASGADGIILDLEDGVAPASKDAARAHAVSLLEAGNWDARRTVLRINHPSSPEGIDDLEALLAVPSLPQSPPLTLMIPKVDRPSDLDGVRARFVERGRDVALFPVVETAAGLARVEEIAGCAGVTAALLGGVDLSKELGCAVEWDALLYARSRLVHAAALAGIDAIDVPFLDLADPAGLEREADAVRRLGFRGKTAFHPAQVQIIQRAFTPSQEEVDRARRILEAEARTGGGAFLIDGRLVDRPVVEAARRTLHLAELGTKPGA